MAQQDSCYGGLKAQPVSFEVSRSDRVLIDALAARAVSLLGHDNFRTPRAAQTHHAMNLCACHANGNSLRLADMLTADDFNFAHDVVGIDRHLNHETGQLENFFSPRFSTLGHGER